MSKRTEASRRCVLVKGEYDFNRNVKNSGKIEISASENVADLYANTS